MRTMAVAVAALLLAAMAGCEKPAGVAAEQAEPTFALRVNCGAEKEYTDQNGVKWLADQALQGEATWGAKDGQTVRRTDLTISDCKMPDVYLTERYSATGYEFAVANGTYTVRLHFAETYAAHNKEGMRLFSVKVNDKIVLEDLDVFKAAGGFAKPLVKEVKGVKVADGKLTVQFVAKTQNPEINGIEVLRY